MFMYQEDLSDVTYFASHLHSMLTQEMTLVQTVHVANFGS